MPDRHPTDDAVPHLDVDEQTSTDEVFGLHDFGGCQDRSDGNSSTLSFRDNLGGGERCKQGPDQWIQAVSSSESSAGMIEFRIDKLLRLSQPRTQPMPLPW